MINPKPNLEIRHAILIDPEVCKPVGVFKPNADLYPAYAKDPNYVYECEHTPSLDHTGEWWYSLGKGTNGIHHYIPASWLIFLD